MENNENCVLIHGLRGLDLINKEQETILLRALDKKDKLSKEEASQAKSIIENIIMPKLNDLQRPK